MSSLSSPKFFILVIAVLTACAFAAATPAALAQSDTRFAYPLSSSGGRCSNQTLSGSYGGTSEGALMPAPGVSLSFRSLQIARFDGKGNVTWGEHTVIGGVLLEPGFGTTATGTYTVNPDCTGALVVDTPNSPVPLNLGMVVVKGGTEIHMVLDTDAVLTVFTKVN
jgi:hypothetical protein